MSPICSFVEKSTKIKTDSNVLMNPSLYTFCVHTFNELKGIGRNNREKPTNVIEYEHELNANIKFGFQRALCFMDYLQFSVWYTVYA